MTTSRRPIIAGNWKMYKTIPEGLAFIEALFSQVQPVLSNPALPEIVIAPPFTALYSLQQWVTQKQAPFHIAAQTMESRDQGAYTGEVSPLMLQDMNINTVIIGHSERRQYFNESNQTVNEKLLAALSHKLQAIVCVGETIGQREAGQTDSLIEQQVLEAIQSVPPEQIPNLIFAYEPVWAIGTGKVCDAKEANRVCGMIRHFLSSRHNANATRILYGGSVKPDNIEELMQQSEIDGALVGGASLDPTSFLALIQGALQKGERTSCV